MKSFFAYKFNPSLTPDDILFHIFSEENTYHPFNDSLSQTAEGFIKYNDVQDYLLVSNVLATKYKKSQKVIVKSYVQDLLNEKIKKIQELEQRIVGKKEQKELKQSIIDSLLPNAAIKSQEIDVILDFNEHLIFIGTTSEKQKDNILGRLINKENQDFNPELIKYTLPFGSAIKDKFLNGWFYSDYNQYNLIPENNYKIDINVGNDIATVQAKKINLENEIMTSPLSNGFISQMTFSLDDEIKFTIKDNLTVSGIKNSLISKKFNSNEETIEDFNNNNLILEINGLNKILSSIDNLLS